MTLKSVMHVVTQEPHFSVMQKRSSVSCRINRLLATPRSSETCHAEPAFVVHHETPAGITSFQTQTFLHLISLLLLYFSFEQEDQHTLLLSEVADFVDF